MLSRSSFSQLAGNLERLRSSGADAEVVQWLRAASPAAAGVAPPGNPGEHGYTRTLLHKTADFEIVVIHWQPNCVTPVHDHGGAFCWFAVAEGTMHVENFLRKDGGEQPGYAQIALEGREELHIGGIDYRTDDRHLHRCITAGAPAATLHVYARPIERFYTFDERANRCLQVDSGYDAQLPY